MHGDEFRLHLRLDHEKGAGEGRGWFSSHPPGSILQVRMRLHSLIAANFAAYLYRYSILGPGLGHVSASGTVGGKMSSCHNCTLAIL
jgi:hypothetical protein